MTFRPLGLGYANLGALLMNLGLPYDSEDGRSMAGAITALMGGAPAICLLLRSQRRCLRLMQHRSDRKHFNQWRLSWLFDECAVRDRSCVDAPRSKPAT
jgi:hypothetical protein